MNKAILILWGFSIFAIACGNLSGCKDQTSNQAPPPQHPKITENDKGPWGSIKNGLRSRILHVQPAHESYSFTIWTEVENVSTEKQWFHLGTWKDGGLIIEDGDGFDVEIVQANGELNGSRSWRTYSDLPSNLKLKPDESVVFTTTVKFSDYAVPYTPIFRVNLYRHELETGDYTLAIGTNESKTPSSAAD